MASNTPPMAANLPPLTVMDFYHRFQALQKHQDTSAELVGDLLIYCEGVERRLSHENAILKKAFEETKLDLEDATKSRRTLQQQVNMANALMAQSNADVELMRNRNPYIMVLVDGDGLIVFQLLREFSTTANTPRFNEELVQQGLEGGKQAANILKDSVLQNCSGAPDGIEIIAKVCANVGGLAQAMRRDGCLDNPDDLKQFTLGFTQGKASFDFIDVGHGKERADSKLKESMRWHLRNHNCKHILLGISHDAGYAPFLDDLIKDEDRGRITIIEGPPTVRELVATGLPTLPFNNIFRAEKLVARVPPTSAATSWAGVTVSAPSPSISPVISNRSHITVPVTTTKKVTTKPTWVPGPRGLDPPTNVNPAVLEKVRRRPKKLCNINYLYGPCWKGEDCCFEHDYKPSEDELKAIQHLTRLNPCTDGQDCEKEVCIYGHHCPSVVMVAPAPGKPKEPVCQAYGCRFAQADHPDGTTIKQPRKERWEKDYERY